MNSSDRPNLEERYAGAIHTSRLVLGERGVADGDILTAAGLQAFRRRQAGLPDDFGTTLHRLQAEFDEARGDQALARKHVQDTFAKADAIERKAAKLTAEAAAPLRARAAGLRKDGEAQAVVERAFILLKLKTLSQVKAQVLHWASVRAARARFMDAGRCPMDAGPGQPEAMEAWRVRVAERNKVVAAIAGRVLDVFLDELCPRCSGRGVAGGLGSPRAVCRACAGCGKRGRDIGENDAERTFAVSLLNELQVIISQSMRSMQGFLSQRD